MAVETVAIVGAGMAGLTAALAFARHGMTCDIFEQAPSLEEVGAGLQLSPNASRVLSKLGILDDLEALWTEPDEVQLASGRSLHRLAYVPSGRFARERWGSPYGVLHRTTLQGALLAAVNANPLCTLRLGVKVGSSARDELAEIATRRHDLIVAADGVWSDLRSEIPKSPEPSFSNSVAWRFTVPKSSAPAWLKPNAVSAFLGPSAHIVAYPLKEKDSFNIVAIASGINPGHRWNTEASSAQKDLLLRHFRGWHPGISETLAASDRPTFWPLYQVSPGRWHNGRDLVLIGDAAHAMLPFAAQGAAMAIEDAFILADRVAALPSLAQALSAFESERASRVAKVRARGEFNRFAYHARGPLKLGRNFVLSMRPPQSLAADLDWLYGFDAE
jgi:salicylate hydroxylase